MLQQTKPGAYFTTSVNKLTLTVNGAGSIPSASGSITSYHWAWGDGTSNNITNGNASAVHVYANPGSYNVVLTINDNKKKTFVSSPAAVTMIQNKLPIADFVLGTFSGYDINLRSNSTDSDGTIASQVWIWGDGTPNTNTANASHTYAQIGNYTITLRVTDDYGGVSTKTYQANVPTELPVAMFTSTVNKLVVSFDASSSTNSFGTFDSYFWTFGDGNTNTTNQPTI